MLKTLAFRLIFLLTVLCRVPGYSQNPTKSQIQGAFIFNFAQFTDWPEQAFSEPDAPFVIGILGDDPFGPFLDQLVRGEKIKGHPIVIRRYTSVEEAATSHLLFVSRDFPIEEEDLQHLAESKQTLTVSDALQFTETGGIIEFFTEDNKVRFEVNRGAMQKSGLILSSKVLRLARLCCDTPE